MVDRRAGDRGNRDVHTRLVLSSLCGGIRSFVVSGPFRGFSMGRASGQAIDWMGNHVFDHIGDAVQDRP